MTLNQPVSQFGVEQHLRQTVAANKQALRHINTSAKKSENHVGGKPLTIPLGNLEDRAPSMALDASLESHMTEISKTVLQLAQAHKKIASTQQQKSSDHGNCPAATSKCFCSLLPSNRSMMPMFGAVPRYDSKNKEECAMWLNQISSLATLAQM